MNVRNVACISFETLGTSNDFTSCVVFYKILFDNVTLYDMIKCVEFQILELGWRFRLWIRLNDSIYLLSYFCKRFCFVHLFKRVYIYVYNIVPKTQMHKNCENTEDKW